MKNKLNKHLLFWLAAAIQGTLMEYAWIHTIFVNASPIIIIWQAWWFSIAFLPAKLFFTYYALYTITAQVFKKSYNAPLIFFKLTGALFIAIVLHRCATAYCIIPHEFPKRAPYTLGQIFNPPWLLVSLLDIGYVAGVAIALRLFRMQISSLQNERDLTKEKLETELKFLKNQIQPHFLFNTLNNIYGLARKKSDETPTVVLRLANLLRFMLYDAATPAITVSKEMKILEDYIQLEKIRYTTRLDVRFCKEIDDDSRLISPLILLPFVENAFKHGVNDTVNDTHIAIRAILRDGQFVFEIKNSHNQTCTDGSGKRIGLNNVRRQLELTYNDFSLDITNQDKQFVVNLKINLNSNGKL